MKRTGYSASKVLIAALLICSPSLVNPSFAQRTITKPENRVPDKAVNAGATVELTIDGRTFVLDEPFFKPGRAELNPAGRQTLSRLVFFMAENPRLLVGLSGEMLWPEAYPDGLSNLRAESVRHFLIDRGISVHRVVLLIAARADGVNTGA